jgi:hypothetical protein
VLDAFNVKVLSSANLGVVMPVRVRSTAGVVVVWFPVTGSMAVTFAEFVVTFTPSAATVLNISSTKTSGIISSFDMAWLLILSKQ